MLLWAPDAVGARKNSLSQRPVERSPGDLGNRSGHPGDLKAGDRHTSVQLTCRQLAVMIASQRPGFTALRCHYRSNTSFSSSY